ncbi:MAG: sodium:solute symporter family protein, partial [Bacteroidota bacterium]
MQLAFIDWAIIVAFLLLSLWIGLRYRNQAGRSLTDFFLGGRNLPWYVAGISMVATTFAADTPLAVSELVAQNGISGNWLWWSLLMSGMLTTFFFARLWRRANVLTDLELIAIRYHGPQARFLRGFRAIYLGLFMNGMIIGWVNLALMSLLTEFFGIPDDQVLWYILGAMAVAMTYSALSGLKGVAITDMVQFAIAMIGCIILAVLVLNSEEVGGVAGLKANLPATYFELFPSVGSSTDSSSVVQALSLSIGTFLSFVVVQWWASWYPGAEPGGGGYVAQRLMSTKNERHAVLSTLFFQVGHYCLRPWPWILVGLCAVFLYSPEFRLDDPAALDAIASFKAEGISLENARAQSAVLDAYLSNPESPEGRAIRYAFNERLGYVYAMADYLPTGLKGLLLVAFLAAYLSTISTQLNWGASYLVNDFLLLVRKPAPNEDPEQQARQQVRISRITTVAIMLISLAITSQLDSISGVWRFIIECGAGLGLVLILRWYWWRINAWSEIAATVAPFIGYAIGHYWLENVFGPGFTKHNGPFLFTVGFTTICWLTVTAITAPTARETLLAFYR